jgi:uncharacterized caspase-like protein
MNTSYYKPTYENSFALVVGINNYLHASPLGYAVSDAEAVAALLETDFDFKSENIKLLLNERATRNEIMSTYMSYVNSEVSPNDRIFVFFAGHGMTQTGKRGEVGFLVPYDGDESNLYSLIRWDDLTRNAELIVAKHILFVMDACYGGLAITRSISVGSMRFLKDMLQRYSRQVLTAGKANEVVADAGGPIPNHSVFTGHFLQGLQGKAATSDGIITANGVMAYVYDRVAKDLHSHQTPHYGFLDGDGDFIFKAPSVRQLTEKDKIDEDVLVSVSTPSTKTEPPTIDDLIEKTKEYLSDSRYKIKLHEVFNQKLREVVALLADDQFKAQGGTFSDEEFIKRIKLYEGVVKEIQAMTACVAYWGNNDHYQLLSKTIARVCDNLNLESGIVVWLNLRWYPVLLLLYSAGISAVYANNFDALATILTTKVRSSRNIYDTAEVILSVGEAAANLNDVFTRLPGHERHYVPRSEYLFKLLQPGLDDLLFLGRDYEQVFDRFEVFLALVYADLAYNNPDDRVWGPLGRFGWKYRSRGGAGNVYSEILKEANTFKSEWPPLKAGLFSGSIERFLEISRKFEELLQRLKWL